MTSSETGRARPDPELPPAPTSAPPSRGSWLHTEPVAAPWQRIAAGVLVAAAVFVVTVVECFLVIFYVGRTPIPIAQVLVVTTNLAGPWAMRAVTGRPAAGLAAIAAWLVAVLPLTAAGPGGDVIVPANWQGITYLLTGAGAALLAMVLGSRTRSPAHRDDGAGRSDRTGGSRFGG